ncbi:hypothetical protein HN295_20200, partial [Acinetobacter baumannii]|uniref:hypothetical protein n=1 Tax=Acinetobacter baumannii TaxID=470 RepID=UPI00189A11B4
WVRIGDGSRADYHQVAAIGAAARHTSLNFPLNASHPAGSLVREIAPTPAVPALTPLALRDPVDAGATELVVTGSAAIIGNLVAAMPLPLNHQLLQVGLAAAAEYVFATTVTPLSATEARLTLATPLRLPHGAG